MHIIAQERAQDSPGTHSYYTHLPTVYDFIDVVEGLHHRVMAEHHWHVAANHAQLWKHRGPTRAHTLPVSSSNAVPVVGGVVDGTIPASVAQTAASVTPAAADISVSAGKVEITLATDSDDRSSK